MGAGRYFAGAGGLSRVVTALLGARRAGLIATALAAILGLAAAAPAASSPAAGSATKLVRYRGVRLRVPAAWPVFELARAPRTCVRFDRHAVYLGTPGTRQDCPASGLGRTEAILVGPRRARPATAAAAQPLGGSELERRLGPRRVTVTATWARDPGVIARALGDPAIGHDRAAGLGAAGLGAAGLGAAGLGTAGPGGRGARIAADAARRVARPAAGPFTGLGFDTCEDPSPTQLNAWLASGYRALGTYIGGANMGCSQPNLSAAYVTAEVAAGWHLIPTYVGLQAPTNSCGCASITPRRAAAQGTAAAQDAVAEAQAVGIGAGSPIYFDMEAYPTGATNTETVLGFLSAWSSELHALGYLSGVYSSSDSGIRDLASAYGASGATTPDEIWTARWNDARSTADPNLPGADWAAHQRVHQYAGGHDETYAKVTLNIDGDYVDAATVGAAAVTPAVAAPAPVLGVAPQSDGAISLDASWSGMSGIASWRLLGGVSPAALAPLSGLVASAAITTHSAFPYYAEEAYGPAGQRLGVSSPTPAPAHVTIYGASAFVPASHGLAGVPVGCFTGAACHLTTIVSYGRTVIARTKPEGIGAGSSGLAYFALTAAGRRLLGAAAAHRLPATVTVLDGSGARASRTLNLIPYAIAGPGPSRAAVQSPSVRVVGYTDFVSRAGFGGILADCATPAPCRTSVTLSAGGATIAQTGAEFMGANELGYVSFRLTPQGRTLLAAAPGNQLGVELRLGNGADTTRGGIALVRFR